MQLIECRKLKKYYGERQIIEIDDLKIYQEDRIGIVGANGAGKTTLINLLSQHIQPDEGTIKVKGNIGYISQLQDPEEKYISYEMASKFKVDPNWSPSMSGGEKTRFKVAAAFDDRNAIIFADEPTSNLDVDSIELMEAFLLRYQGALVIISHDRSLLNRICNQIIEVENGKIKSYKGNYTDYKEQKNQERNFAYREYKAYVDEKKRLESVMKQKKKASQKVKRTPKRMGNSEARLHKMGGQKAKANLDNAVKSVRSRVEHLEIKEKPEEDKKIQLDILPASQIHSKFLVEGNNINKSFDNKTIFKDANFKIENGAKIALVGPNGSGKSTLINMILDNAPGIKKAPSAKIGYFNQELNILDPNLTILDNVMQSSIYSETIARLLLARLIFRGEKVYKPVNVLSGGELVKVSFAKILLEDFNMLILDEPTNYLDISSLEVIEEALKDYDRTLLFVSHDRQFVESVANQIMTIQDQTINTSLFIT